ncbi:MAG: PQQ-dependent sugar dehydrogenase [Anaerolineae bacterium]
MLNKRMLILSIFIGLSGWLSIEAQTLPPCAERDYITDFPRVITHFWCRELPYPAESDNGRTYSALLIADDGTFYATHPHRGELVRLLDNDGDGLPDDERVLADDLRYPNGLTLIDETLYIIGDGVLYAWRDEQLTLLTDALPGGRGFMARGIAQVDDQLYIGIPAPCDACVGEDARHGTILRLNADGSDPTVIAQGLRYPAGIVYYDGALWVTDIAPEGVPVTTFYDEINRLDLTSDHIPHFGFPHCIGGDNTPTGIGEFDCAEASAPALTFRSHSSPIALTHYGQEAFPNITDSLLVTLLGSNQNRFIAGHAIVAIRATDQGYAFETVMPADDVATPIPARFTSANGRNITLDNAEFVNNQAGGIFPAMPYDVTVSPQGWLYISIHNRGIYVLRPLSN